MKHSNELLPDPPDYYSMSCLCRRYAVAKGGTLTCPGCKVVVTGAHITSEKYFAVQALLAFAKSLQPSGEGHTLSNR